jgi:6-pyruvoyltetrahydropterin/6-carboxytetrahydropterin synthase
MIIGVAVKFDAAHYLPNYPGKCVNMHGHTWYVEVEVTGAINDKTGMVVDLAILKRDVLVITELFDHQVLNELLPFVNNKKPPTCELVAQYIHDRLIAQYNIQTVKVREGEGGWARI